MFDRPFCALWSKTSTVMMPTINIGKTKKKTALPLSPGSKGTTSTNCGGDVRVSSTSCVNTPWRYEALIAEAALAT